MYLVDVYTRAELVPDADNKGELLILIYLMELWLGGAWRRGQGRRGTV